MKLSRKFMVAIAVVLVFSVTSVLAWSLGAKKSEKENSNVEDIEDIEDDYGSRANVTVSPDSLAVVEAMQDVFRSVADNVLPSVVEVDVVETTTRNVITPFDIPFYFFGNPFGNGEEGEEGRGRKKEFKSQGLGSGVIVSREKNTYYVLTNNHVAGKATEISVKLYDTREFKCKLIGADERKDIALISFESKDDLKVAKLANSDKVRTGDICFAIGTPLGYFSSVTQGIVSATGRSGSQIGNISDFIQTDASINQGNSGGPLVNIYGEVIGINTWIASSSGGSVGIGFAIPINNIKKSINDFKTKGKISYGWMGVSLSPADRNTLEQLGIENQKGAFVSQIFLNSPAFKGGIKVGDYVIKLNGKNVRSVDQLVNDVGQLPANENAEFVVIRNGVEKTLTIKVEERDDNVVANSSKLWPGFFVDSIPDDFRKESKLPRDIEGVLIVNVQSKSPASVLRLQPGDIITAVNGNKVSSLRDFYRELSSVGNECWFEYYSSEGNHNFETQKYKF